MTPNSLWELMTLPFFKFICTSCHDTNASIPTQPSPIHSQPNYSPIITLPSINSSARTHPPTNTVTNPLPQQTPMITLNSIDRKLDTFKQTLDTIRIKQDQYHSIRHQSNFTAPIRLPTDSSLRYNMPPFPNIDTTSPIPQYHLLTEMHALPTNHYATDDIYLTSQTSYINLLIIFTLIHDSNTNILHLNLIISTIEYYITR